MPTATIPIAASGDDTAYDRSDTGYPPAGSYTNLPLSSPIHTARSLLGGVYIVRHLLFRFPTSTALPDDALVASATLRVYVIGRTLSAAGYGVVWDYHAWTPAPADWTNTPLANAYATPATISLFPVNTTFDFVLQNAYENVLGTQDTYLRSHVTQAAGDAPPTQDNSLGVASYDNVGGFPVPTLIVDYEVPQAMPPTGIVQRINLPNVNGVPADDATALAAINEDPASPDADWLTN